MTKFETRGCEMQYIARDIEDANRRFDNSCRICCERGIRLDCDYCAIRATHEMLIAYFASSEEERKNGKWVLKVS